MALRLLPFVVAISSSRSACRQADGVLNVNYRRVWHYSCRDKPILDLETVRYERVACSFGQSKRPLHLDKSADLCAGADNTAV